MIERKPRTKRSWHVKYCKFGKIPAPALWPAPEHTLKQKNVSAPNSGVSNIA